MRNQELILSLPNGDLELYSLILSFYLDTVILPFDQNYNKMVSRNYTLLDSPSISPKIPSLKL
jgi:hypothetical protein